jgi:hypothetical protein
MAESTGMTPPFSDEDLSGIIGNQISQSRDYAQDFLEENRRQAWKYYLGRRGRGEDFSATTNREGYTREGGSEAVSEDVSDMVEALMATIMPIFGSDVPVSFEPTGPDDEENAAAESDAVASVLMDSNNGWILIAEAVKDALLLRNATVKVWIEQEVTTERRSFKDISDADLGEFMAAIPDGIDATITSRKGRKAGVRLERTVRTPRIAAVQQAHFLVDPNHDNIFIDNSFFVAERKFSSRSELLTAGFKKSKVDNLPAFTNDTDVDSTASNIEGISGDLQRPTFDTDVIEWYEVYMRIDLTGDGRSELMRFDWSNDHLLDKNPAGRIPYATGTAWLVPHRYSGLSVYDKLQQVTDIKSRVLQQYLDNLTTNNTARTAVNENTVNIDDLLAGRPNAVIRNDGSPQEDIMPFPTNDTGQSSQSLLQYMDQVRDQRAGAALSFQQPQDQLAKANVSAASADRQMSPGEQMAAMVARTLAETLMRSIFLLLHDTLRTQFPEPMQVNRSGQWSEQIPSQWIPRNRVNVKVGLSPAERNRKAQSLITTVQQQVQMFTGGGANIMVDMNGIHRAILDWSRAVDLDNADQYWIDPESDRSQQAAKSQSEQQQAEQAAQLEAFTAEATASDNNSQRDFEIDKMKIQLGYFNSILDSEIEDAKIISDAIQQATSAAIKASGDNSGNGASVGQAEG